jgi:ATPase subunit of ABC transporter with duplicated ATPase domains
MSVSLVARGLSIAHGAHVVLHDVSLTVGPRARIGVVGPNGAGKSTLLRALAGLEVLDAGSVERLPPSATVGYLSQELDRHEGETVRDVVARRTGVAAAEQELVDASAALVDGTDAAADRFDVALARHAGLGAADLDARLAVTAAELGLSAEVLARPTVALSGGEAARVGLAALVLSRFDVVLLDEPTNDLDLDGLARLEVHIVATNQAVVLVSHDRAFLERTITSVAEIDAHDGSLQVFNGGWTAYQELAATARRHAEDDYATYRDQRDRLHQRAATERSWADKGVKRAKASGEQDKFIRHNNTSSSEHVAARARRTERAAERLEVVDKPWEGWELRLTFTEAPRSGTSVARLDRAVVERGEFTLGPIDLEITAGERVVLLGANGLGKSTLLAALLGEVDLDRGHRAGRGSVGDLFGHGAHREPRPSVPRQRGRHQNHRAGPRPTRRSPLAWSPCPR